MKTKSIHPEPKALAYPGLKPFYSLLVVIAVCICLSHFPSRAQDNAEHIIQGIPCKGEAKYFKDNKLNSCVLSKEHVLDEYRLPAGTIVNLNTDGTLSSCYISKETSFAGQVLPAKSTVFFNMWGEKISFWLSENTLMQGHLLKASGDGPGMPLYPNGQLKEIWLANDQVIEGIPCTTSGSLFKYGWHVVSLGTNRRVRFHDNGHVERALLSHDFTLQGHSYKRGELVFLDRDGKIDLQEKK